MLAFYHYRRLILLYKRYFVLKYMLSKYESHALLIVDECVDNFSQCIRLLCIYIYESTF